MSHYSFADDVAILVEHDSLDEAERIMQDNFNKVLKWSHDKKLVINMTKSKVLHIKSPHLSTRDIFIATHDNACLHSNFRVNLPCGCDSKLEQVQEQKYLGVIIDGRFKFDRHIEWLVSKLRASSYVFFHLRRLVSGAILATLYSAIVEQVIRYGILVWGNTTRTFLLGIVNAQHRIIRSIVPVSQQNICAGFRHLRVLPVIELFKYVLALKFYFSDEHRVRQEHMYQTRNNFFIQPLFVNDYGRQCFRTSVPELFNGIPERIRSLDAISKVKKEIKQWLLEQLTYS